MLVALAVGSGLVIPSAVSVSLVPAPEAAPVTVIAGLHPGVSAGALAKLLGATVKGTADNLGIAVFSVANGPGLVAALQANPGVRWAHLDGGVTALGAGWDGAGWDGAGWDGAGWDGAGWDGAGWDGAGWDGAGWDGAGWDGAGWDGAGWDGAGWDGAGWDGAGWDGGSWGRAPIPPWGIVAVRAPEAWKLGSPAHSRLVCVVDSGVDPRHPAIAPNYWLVESSPVGYNFVDGNADPTDTAGHGTAMAGIIAGVRPNGFGFAGMGNPLITAAKVLNDEGRGTTSAVILGISWCMSQKANVILLALSEDEPTVGFHEAVQGAALSGRLVVAAAGNNGPCEDCVTSPGNIPGVLTVGAVNPFGFIPPFSAKGPELDLLAPGVWITSAYKDGGARMGSGTSQAAAFVAGAAAYVWAKRANWTSDMVALQLTRTAKDWGPSGFDSESGFGVLDFGRAAGPIRVWLGAGTGPDGPWVGYGSE